MSNVTIQVQRSAAGESARTEAFDVPYSEGMSVLDALIWIRANTDPTLAFRYSCINANACKECVVLVDGETDYACTARLREGETLVEPLAGKRHLRDLVCDTVPPKERGLGRGT